MPLTCALGALPAAVHSAKVRLPRELAGVMHDAEVAAPETAGLSAKKVAAIEKALEAVYRSGAYPAVSLCLRRRGQIVLHRSYGHARGNGPLDAANAPKKSFTLDTPVCLFSASKAITGILVHKLAEEGGIDLDKPVAHYLPAFAQNGKAKVTIGEVLAHRGGFPSLDIPKADRKVEMLNDWDFVIGRICASPGARFRPMAYHAITSGFLLAEVIQRVTGMSLADYHDSRLRQPLGMKYFTYGLPKKQRASVALNYAAGMPVLFPVAPMIERALMVPFNDVVAASNTDVFMDTVIPAGNLYSTAEELSRFFQMLLDDGMWNGKRVLEKATIARAVRPRGRTMPDATLMLPMRYSEGMMLGGPLSLFGPATSGAYGHLGFMNILGWADPARELSGALLVTGKAVVGPHLLPWMGLMASIARNARS